MPLESLGRKEIFAGDDYTTFSRIRVSLRRQRVLYAVLEYSTLDKYRGKVLINYAFTSRQSYQAVTPPVAEIYDFGVRLGIVLPINRMQRDGTEIIFGAKRQLYYSAPSQVARAFLELSIDTRE